MKSSPLAIAGLVLLAATVTACGSSDTSSSASGTSAPATGAASGKDSSQGGKKVDACTLLEPDEITPIIGENDGGHPDAGVGESVCNWENPDTYQSVTLSIGSPNTAGSEQIDNSMMTGFTLGDRLCTIQVVTLKRDADKKTEAKLIALLQDRI
ncbi:DUF3558 family protein [Streptomyces sp. NPDC046977]|uniref:DUF3558 family protein n=1 Tax=Streptomyces sp. NPDC046977 TaxID=3154703 RepID=UPI0033CD4461